MSLLVCEAECPSYRALVHHSLESNVVTLTILDKEAENQVSLLVTSLSFFLLKNKTKTNKQTNKPSSPLSSPYSKIRVAQRRLAWPLSKEDTEVCDVFHRQLRDAGNWRDGLPQGRAHQRLFNTSWSSPTT